MKPTNVRYIVASLILGLMFVGSVVLNLYMTERIVTASQGQWCTVLQLLTSKPVKRPADPQKNPAKENAYVFYVNLITLETHFHC